MIDVGRLREVFDISWWILAVPLVWIWIVGRCLFLAVRIVARYAQSKYDVFYVVTALFHNVYLTQGVHRPLFIQVGCR